LVEARGEGQGSWPMSPSSQYGVLGAETENGGNRKRRAAYGVLGAETENCGNSRRCSSCALLTQSAINSALRTRKQTSASLRQSRSDPHVPSELLAK